MSLMDKKISELTAEDIQNLAKPVGIEGLPYPMVMYAPTGKNGALEQKIGVIDNLDDAMTVYTEMPMEKVQGKLFREMPIPSMMLMLRDLLAKQAPTSRNRIFTVFGDPAFGKSFLFKSVASIVHPQGAIQVDCGGMNMREIFFRTVIDYGAGVQEVFAKRVEEGKISQETINYLNAEFPDSIITKDDKSVVDWERIGARKEGEDRGAAMERAVHVMNVVYDREKITHHSNSFGIKTVPGEFFESLWSGRPLFLDEFNKSKRGTLDSWQTALQFLNGEEDSVTIYNPMSQSSSDEQMKAITVKRADIKAGFFVGVAGNETIDGDTTQELSQSMMTRLNPMYVGEPTLRDWEHRVSQIWTGLPLVTLYHLFQDFAGNKPAEFGQALLELRKLGLNAKEVAAIPAREIYFLQNWQETVQAAKQAAAYYNFRHLLSDTESVLFDRRKELRDLANEISSDAKAKQISVSFRKSIADNNKAIEGAPEARIAEKLKLDIQGAFRAVAQTGAEARAPGWHRFGLHMSNAIVEDILNVTKDMPLTRAALIAECTAQGIIPATFKEAKPSGSMKPLSDLMKYDENKDLGGTEELKAVRNVIMMALRSRYPEMKATDDQVIPLKNLGMAIQAIKADKTEKGGVKKVIVSNDDLNEVKSLPLVEAEAVASYNMEDASRFKNTTGVDFRAILAAMAIPEYSDQNREKLWLDDLMAEMKKRGYPAPKTEDEKEMYNVLIGKAAHGFHIAVLSAEDSQKKQVFLYVIEDKVRGQMIVVGPEKVPVSLTTTLDKNGVMYLSRTETDAIKKIDDFLTEGSTLRHKSSQAPKGTNASVVTSLILALGLVGKLPEEHTKMSPQGSVIKEGSTFGGIITSMKEDSVAVSTCFVKRKKLTL